MVFTKLMVVHLKRKYLFVEVIIKVSVVMAIEVNLLEHQRCFQVIEPPVFSGPIQIINRLSQRQYFEPSILIKIDHYRN